MNIDINLASAIRELASAKTLQGVMDIVKVTARDTIGADGVTFVLRDGDQCYYAEEDAIAPLWKGKRFPMSICISGWVMLNQREAIIPDILMDERIPVEAYRPTFVKSLVMVPVRRADPVAAIGAYWAQPHAATQQELEILLNLADAASVAMSNVELTNRLNTPQNDLREIVKRIHKEQELRHLLEERFSRIYKYAALGIVIETAKGSILQCNPAFCRILGYSESEIIERSYLDFIHPEDLNANLKLLQRLISGEVTDFEIENRLLCKNNRTTWVKKAYSILPDEDPPTIIALVTDISDRKAWELERDGAIKFLGLVNNSKSLEELIHAATTFFQQISGCEAVGIRLKNGVDYPYYETHGFPAEFVQLENKLCSYDVDGKTICDQNGEPILECMCGNVICGRFDPALPFFTKRGSFWSNCTTELLASTTAAQRQANTRNRCNGSGYESVALLPLRSGSERYGLLQFNDKQHNRFTLDLIHQWEHLAEYLAVALSKFKAEADLIASEERTELALKGGDLGAWDLDIGSEKLWFDDRWVEMLGYEPTDVAPYISSWEKLLHPDDMPLVKEAMNKYMEGETEHYSMQYRLQHKNGDWIWVLSRGRVVERDGNGQPLRICGTHMDITQQRQLEERIRQTEKMDAIGQLAGGVAHDFNNQLTGILGYADMLLYEDNAERQEKYIQAIISAANKSADLTQQLLAFSRKAECQAIPVNIHDIIHEVTSILKHTIDKRIELRTFFNTKVTTVIGDPSMLQNALLNLAINARDAMPEGGVLTFETSNEMLDTEYCKTIPYEITAGPYLKISISDTGYGIAPADLKRIFEPFFTTKELGKGTGMGLAAVYGTVKHHQGAINVYSEPGIGTIFRVYLPLTEKDADTAVKEFILQPHDIAELHILVIEDEESIRTLLTDILEDEGCTVTAAADGAEALTIYQEQWQEFDLVIFDMIMPKLDGKDTFNAMRAINPDIRAILSSGYSLNGAASDLLSAGVKVFIQKPFTRAQINKAIATVTGRHS